MSGISVNVIILVAMLAALSLISLHLVKEKEDGYIKIKFGPFVFEYGKSAETGNDDELPAKPPAAEVESGDSGKPEDPGP